MKSASTLSFLITFIRLSGFQAQEVSVNVGSKGIAGSNGNDDGILSILKGKGLKAQADEVDAPIETETNEPVKTEDDKEPIEGASIEEAENRKHRQSGHKHVGQRGYRRIHNGYHHGGSRGNFNGCSEDDSFKTLRHRHHRGKNHGYNSYGGYLSHRNYHSPKHASHLRYEDYDSDCSDDDSYYRKDYNKGHKQEGIYRRDVAEAENYHKNGDNWHHPSHHRGVYGSGWDSNYYGIGWGIYNNNHYHGHRQGNQFGYGHKNGVYRRDVANAENYGHNKHHHGHHRGVYGSSGNDDGWKWNFNNDYNHHINYNNIDDYHYHDHHNNGGFDYGY